jgi:capsular polysaccharide biosynthesis protein
MSSSDDAVRLSLVAQVLRQRWRLLAALAAAGAILGAGASLLFSPGYQTSANVLMQGPREPDELLTQTQIAASSVVLDRAATALGWNVNGVELQDSVTAKVANGNVISISATAETPERAQQLADQVAQEYVTFATQLISNTTDASAAQSQRELREALRQQIAMTNERVRELHATVGSGLTVESVQARTELEGLRTTLAQAITKLDEAEEASSQANMVVMGQAELPSSPAAPTLTHFIAGGALLLALLGLLGHLIATRTDRRLRSESDIGAALGAPILGSIDVPDLPQAEEYPAANTSWYSRLRQLILVNEDWNAPRLPGAGDDASREIRCRRVLSRLRAASDRPPWLYVLATDDDATAGRAIMALQTLNNTANAERLATLRAIGVYAGRPTVPDNGNVSGVLVLVTAGTRTAWELVGIAEACADAGHEIIGVVITYRTRPAARQQLEPSQPAPPRVSLGGGKVAGPA